MTQCTRLFHFPLLLCNMLHFCPYQCIQSRIHGQYCIQKICAYPSMALIGKAWAILRNALSIAIICAFLPGILPAAFLQYFFRQLNIIPFFSVNSTVFLRSCDGFPENSDCFIARSSAHKLFLIFFYHFLFLLLSIKCRRFTPFTYIGNIFWNKFQHLENFLFRTRFFPYGRHRLTTISPNFSNVNTAKKQADHSVCFLFVFSFFVIPSLPLRDQ